MSPFALNISNIHSMVLLFCKFEYVSLINGTFNIDQILMYLINLLLSSNMHAKYF